MKKLIPALIAAAVVLGLAGCSAPAGQAEVNATPTVEPTAAPVTMAPDASTEPTAAPAGTDEDYLAAIKYFWHGELPDDDALLGARDLACDQLEAGTPADQVVAVEGDSEDALWNNQKTVQFAGQVTCLGAAG